MTGNLYIEKLSEGQRADDLRQEEMARQDSELLEARKYNVGDKVWYAYYEHTQVQKPCPVCFGNKEVTLILGNRDKVLLPCDYCGHGFEPARGYVTKYEYVAKAEIFFITRIQSETDKVGEKRRYYSGNSYAEVQDLFDTEEQALVRCAEKVRQQEIEQTTRAYNIKANTLKSYAWNAGYHLSQARRHKKDAEYHDKMAVLCEEKRRN